MFALMSMISCDMVEYSPNQKFDRDSPHNLNLTNLDKLLNVNDDDDSVTIAFIGDSQRFYNEVELFVSKVNEQDDVDFVLLAGDISDFGLLQELEWVNESLKKLKVPYFAVVGNHDVVGNGHNTFEYFFGPLNFSFQYKGYKFVMHNTNGREYKTENVPDLDWLAKEFNDPTAAHIIGVSHVPPYDGDFNENLEQAYSELVRNQDKFRLSLHGHQHRHTDWYPYEDGKRYITSHYFEERQFIKLTLIDTLVLKKLVSY